MAVQPKEIATRVTREQLMRGILVFNDAIKYCDDTVKEVEQQVNSAKEDVLIVMADLEYLTGSLMDLDEELEVQDQDDLELRKESLEEELDVCQSRLEELRASLVYSKSREFRNETIDELFLEEFGKSYGYVLAAVHRTLEARGRAASRVAEARFVASRAVDTEMRATIAGGGGGASGGAEDTEMSIASAAPRSVTFSSEVAVIRSDILSFGEGDQGYDADADPADAYDSDDVEMRDEHTPYYRKPSTGY